MNILLVIPSNTGTIASVSYNLYCGLRKQLNVKVYTACLGQYDTSGYQFDDVFKLGQGGKGLLSKISSRVFGLRRIKKEKGIDISIATLLGAIYWNILAGCGEFKIGVFHTKLLQKKYEGRLIYWIYYLADKLFVARLDKMIAVNKSAFNDLMRLHNDRNRIELVYNIHNFNTIERLALDEIENVDEKEIFDGGHIILYVGALYCNVKGTDRLVEAFSKVVKHYGDYKLVFIGGDAEGSLEKLKQIAVQLGIMDSVYFFGQKANPYQYMRRAEMLVSPSRDEGLPGVIIESLSLGTKVVATNSSIGVWEIMQCESSYDSQLYEVRETDFGYITPNILDNENKTVDFLSQAILTCIGKEFNNWNKFDKARFSEEHVIQHFIRLQS